MTEMKNGVIVGIINDVEWMLPWWWMNYRLHNDFPVTFIDFGSNPIETILWARERGDVLKLELPKDFNITKDFVDPNLVKRWEGFHCRIWAARQEWYKKPFSLLQSPYDNSIWIDLDCQVRGSVQPIFDSLKESFAVPLEPERTEKGNLENGFIRLGQVMYNAGVIGYKKRSPIIEEWCQRILKEHHLHYADQQMLAQLLDETSHRFGVLPLIYNWFMDKTANPKALILHYICNCKQMVRNQMLDFETNYHFSFPFEYDPVFDYRDRVK